MKPYEIRITKQAKKDIDKLTPKLTQKLQNVLIEIIAENPFEGKKLLGDLEGSYSYRLSDKDRMVYSIDEKKRIIYLEPARSHYGE